MLILVIMSLLIFSFTGVAVLDVAYNSRSASYETINNIKVQYVMESEVNEALWRINVGEDSLANLIEEDASCIWDSTAESLTIIVDAEGIEAEVVLDLADDHHFGRGLSSANNINTNGYSTGLDKGNAKRRFNFLPQLDLQFFIDNNVQIHHGNDQSWKGEYLVDEGIHIFTGNNLEIDTVSLSNSTLVFTGRGITFNGFNTLKAPVPSGSELALPALVFTNPDADVTISWTNHIEGAIFCAGEIILGSATLSGPVVANLITLNDNIDFLDTEFSEYYRWTAGFGSQDNYDWPKQIGRWKTKSWKKVSSS